ncbi:MAG: Inosine-uridine preferring nucleoside hydrolase [Solirubrobacterales bacterium]|nr:Inosine-uridine preferring nucleoside hydrolase [Solirubrobacterales bacterium]
MPTPLVIDCDPGIDDAVSLALALASPELDVRAVTTVAGNVSLERTTDNALRLLHAFGRDDITVAAGAARALVRRPARHPPLHGPNGLGGVRLPEPAHGASAESAIETLARVVSEAPDRSVTIAALGPLTNVALFLAVCPDLAERIGRLVVMGGAVGGGNITPVAEFNVWADPEAAQRVLAGSGLDICLVGLGVTTRATLDDRALTDLHAGSQRGALLAEIVMGYGDHAPGGWPLHDALVLASLVDPTLISTRPASVEVDTGCGIGRAQTVCGFDGHDGEGAGLPQVAVDVDADRFRELLLSRLAAG